MRNPLTKEAIDENAESFLNQLAEIIVDQFLLDQKRERRLRELPKGYYLDDESGFYSCSICNRNFEGKDIWYDKYGYKCKDCNNNVLKRVISRTLSKKKDNWCSDRDVTSILKIHPATRDKLIRQNKLKFIALKDNNGDVYMRIFMKKSNPLLK